jgi:hypothetical protein|uniref:Uncharacterized protein n=1 Tax=Dictyoglomus turgidum TaxID=513050 RepID=A0A7C3WLD5_9BACT
MEQLIIILILFLFMTFLLNSQRWYNSYLKEKDKKRKDLEIYVMNLKERQMFEMEKQGFVTFVRFLFLLSLFPSFIKNLVRSLIIEIKFVKNSMDIESNKLSKYLESLKRDN